jgi:hypothetical protein
MAEALTAPFVMHGARDAIAAGLTHIEQQVRSIEQAIVGNPGLLISVRMMFDRIDTQYRDAAKYLPELPPLNQRRWVTVLMSSRDLPALKLSAQAWSQRLARTDLAIYASQNGYYALVIKGDGSFTFAYNKTVELQKSGTAGAYFAESENWGKDYLAG